MSSHSLNLSASLDVTFPKLDRSGGQTFKPGIGYGESPTITYAPLAGEDYVKRLLKPIDVEEIIALTHSGWSIERVFNITVQQINDIPNAPTAAGPTPDFVPEYEDFHKLTYNLRTLQMAGLIQLGSDPRHDPTKLSVILDPGKTQYIHIEKDERYRAEIEELYRMLNVSTVYHDISITTNFLKDYQDNRIKLKPRTLLGSLFYLSQAVQVPREHINKGLVTTTAYCDGTPFNWCTLSGQEMVIQSSKSKPKDAAIKVYYRGHWFYIEDSDLQSKSSFMLISKLFDIKAAGGGPAIPQLTIPVRD